MVIHGLNGYWCYTWVLVVIHGYSLLYLVIDCYTWL